MVDCLNECTIGLRGLTIFVLTYVTVFVIGWIVGHSKSHIVIEKEEKKKDDNNLSEM